MENLAKALVTCGVCGADFKPILGSRSPFCSPQCRFVAKVEVGSECWLWTGAQDSNGYGHMRDGQRTVKAHRFSYETAVERIPDGLEIDHLCRVRLCVNPDHLEPVTDHENWIRGNQPGAIVVRNGRCKRDHSMADAIIRPNGARRCRTCRNEQKREAYAADRRARANA